MSVPQHHESDSLVVCLDTALQGDFKGAPDWYMTYLEVALFDRQAAQQKVIPALAQTVLQEA